MGTSRQHSAWLLLTALLVGGLMAPQVHQVRHAQEQAAAAVASADPHRTHDAATVEPVVPSMQESSCTLCLFVIHGAFEPDALAEAGHTATPLVLRAPSHVASRASRLSLIRGPPVAA